jgi:thiamine-phosphate pyrophosphorylase
VSEAKWKKYEEARYYFITDRGLSRQGNVDDVRAAIAGGVKIVQYREKDLPVRDQIREALTLRDLCRGGGVVFLMNDRVDVALAVEADGVHLGQEDMPLPVARRLLGPEKIIGVTVGSVEEALEAQGEGADYLASSPVFATQTKEDAGPAIGLTRVRDIRRRVDLPVVGIGGITPENARRVIEAGADCVCAISAIVTKKDVRGAVEEFLRVLGAPEGDDSRRDLGPGS